jgi:hypothetical protein
MSRSCFASFPVCVYTFSSHYLNNIIFIDDSLGPLETESPCTLTMSVHFCHRPPASINATATGRISMTFDVRDWYENLSRKTKLNENPIGNISHFTWTPNYVLFLPATYNRHEIFCVTINIYVLLRVTHSSTIHTKYCCHSIATMIMQTDQNVTLYVQTLPKF